jgi:hypothetical protein
MTKVEVKLSTLNVLSVLKKLLTREFNGKRRTFMFVNAMKDGK